MFYNIFLKKSHFSASIKKAGIFLVCFLFYFNAYNQDLSNIGGNVKKVIEAKPVDVKGGANVTTAFYAVEGIPSRRPPFAYALNGNLNFNFYGKINMPLSINYSDAGLAYNAKNPLKEMLTNLLNKTGVSPKYKWVTVHLGDRSMNFSKYSYAGLRFFGGGIELSPPKSLVKFAAFYGRFNRRTLGDTVNGIAALPAYQRNAWGFRTDFGKKNHKIGLILFKVEDDVFSNDILLTKYQLKPQENLVFAIDTKNKLGKYFDFNFEYTSSAYSSDISAGSSSLNPNSNFNYFNNIGDIYKPVTNSIYNHALNTGLNFKSTYINMGVSYLRVDPTYYSMGAIAAKNDVEAVTLNPGFNAFKGKLTVNGSIGKERNNLAKNMANTMTRNIYNITGNVIIIKDLVFTGTYSNFNFSTVPTFYTVKDSVKMAQINDNKNATLSYSFGSTEYKQTAMVSGTFQNVREIRQTINLNDDARTTTNNVTNYMSNYSITFNSLQLTVALTPMMYNLIEAPENKITSWGPALNLNKKLLDKKLTASLVVAFLKNQEPTADSETTTGKIGAQYKVSKNHSLKFETAVLNKKIKVGTGESFTEYLGKLSYDYNF